MRYRNMLPGETFGQAAERRRREREANAEANAAKREERERLAMTCQCCGNKILANTGKIAHHGFQRPGHGWQTPSCLGARELPYEADREALGKMIVGLKNYRTVLRQALKAIEEERNPITRTFPDYSKPRVWNHFLRRETYPELTFEFTRENFADELKKVPARNSTYDWSYDKLKMIEVENKKTEIKHVTYDINLSTKRYDDWKRTHRFVSKEKGWTKI